MAEYQGEYGHPYPRVDQYGNPVPPVDQYGNPVPREPPASGLGSTADPPYSAGDTVAVHVTALAYEGMVGGGVGGAQLQPTREEHTFGPGAQLQLTKEEHTTTLGEKLRRSGSSSSSSPSEDDGQGGRRKKKSIKEKIKEKLPGSHKHEEQKAGHVAPAPAATTTGTHAAGTHEKKGFMEKIKEKLPGHHH